MSSPVGISPSEIWKALVKCKEIYNAFRGEYRSASQQLVAFREELSRVEAALEFQKTIQSQTGKGYPGEAAFEKTLVNCHAYIEANRARLKEHTRGSDAFKKAVSTVKSTFETEFATLQGMLAKHRQDLLDYRIALLLEATFNTAIKPTDGAGDGTSSSSLQRTRHDPNQVERELSELAGIITSYQQITREREVPSNARQVEEGGVEAIANTHPALVRLNARFWTTIATICRLENVAVDYRPPFISLDNLDVHLASFRKQIKPGANAESLEKPQPLMIFPRRTEIRISVRLESRKSPQPTDIIADTYIFVGRRFIFHDEQRRAAFEHRVAVDCHPYTHHRRKKKQGCIEFLDKQDITLLLSDEGPSEETHKAMVEYHIDDEEAYMRFQSDLKGNHLVREFSFATLNSEFSSDGNDTYFEQIKLWQCNGEHPGFKLSSPARFQDRDMIFEWPLQWLEQVRVDGKPEIVRFVFLHPPPCPWSNPDSKQRRRLIERRPSISKHCTCKSSTASSSSSSVYSSDSGRDSLPYAQLGWLTKVGYLDFKFEESERKLFLEQLDAARNGTTPRLPDSSLSSPSHLNSPISSPNSLQSVSQPSPTASRYDSVQGSMISRGTMYSPLQSRKGKNRADIPIESLPEAERDPSSGLNDPGPTISELTHRMDFASVEHSWSVEGTETDTFYIKRSNTGAHSTPELVGTRPGQLLGLDPKWFTGDSGSS